MTCAIAAGLAGASAGSALPAERVPVTFDDRAIIVLEAPSVAERIAAAATAPTAGTQRGWNAEVEASQQLLLSAMAERGLDVQRDFSYRVTLNGFSARLTPRARAQLERTPGVRGVYPIRAVYAALAPSQLGTEAADLTAGPQGLTGKGVTVAILSTGVEHDHPYLGGRVLPGIDVVSGKRTAGAATQQGGNAVETHGTEMAGIIVGKQGRGVAPGARVLPIRVLGWQRVADGSFAVVGRGDQLIAGLERAADPNGDGHVGDRVQIALVPVVEPYASFADSPESMAVAGASSVGILVVAAAGDDGPAGPDYGSVGGPGGSPAALTVGAAERKTDSRGLFLESGPVQTSRRSTAASFSSTGLAFGGRVKPDLVAPGVGISTSVPGPESLSVVSGSGAAAAVVAGYAALLAEARPDFEGSALKSVLVGSSKPLAEPSFVLGGGAGVSIVGRALNLKVAVSPASVSLRAGKTKPVTVRNVSGKRRTVTFEVGGGARVLRVRPSKVVLEPGQEAAVTIVAGGKNRLTAPVTGVLTLRAKGGPPTRVPVAVTPARSSQTALVGALSLNKKAVTAGAGERLRASFRAGAVTPGSGSGSIAPVEVLDVQLLTRGGKSLGRLMRLYHLLPGRYTIALTGRASDGSKLAPGRYILRLKAKPVDGGPASTVQARFRVVAADS